MIAEQQGKQFEFQWVATEPRKSLGTWLREIYSCSCLTFLPGSAWVLLRVYTHSVDRDVCNVCKNCVRPWVYTHSVVRDVCNVCKNCVRPWVYTHCCSRCLQCLQKLCQAMGIHTVVRDVCNVCKNCVRPWVYTHSVVRDVCNVCKNSVRPWVYTHSVVRKPLWVLISCRVPPKCDQTLDTFWSHFGQVSKLWTFIW